MMMKWTTRAACALLLAAAIGAAGFHVGAQSTRTLEVNQVARVGESVISAEQFIERLVEFERLRPIEDRSGTATLDMLIAERMLELEAERLEARIRPRELGDEMQRLEEAIRDEFRRFREELRKEAQQRGIEEYDFTWREFLERRGMTEQQFQAMVRQVAHDGLMKRLIVGYWESSNERANVQGVRLMTRREAQDVRSRLLRGERIDVVARQLSTERRTRENNGNIGTVWRNDRRLEPVLDKVLWELKDGELSDPVATSDGWWVIRRVNTILANEANFWDVRDQLLAGPQVTDNRFMAWRHALASSGRYAFERRMPGMDCRADEE